jgi:hypothetical protein
LSLVRFHLPPMMRTWLPSLAATRGFGAGLAAEDLGRMGLLSLFGSLGANNGVRVQQYSSNASLTAKAGGERLDAGGAQAWSCQPALMGRWLG